MQQLCDIALQRDVTIIVEPVNRYEINFINSLDDGVAVLAKVQRSNTGLMPDVFHMNIEDAQIGASLARYVSTYTSRIRTGTRPGRDTWTSTMYSMA